MYTNPSSETRPDGVEWLIGKFIITAILLGSTVLVCIGIDKIFKFFGIW